MKKISKLVLSLSLCLTLVCALANFDSSVKVKSTVRADGNSSYFTVYDHSDASKVIFVKGEGINVDDEYLSSDNKLYKIVSVDSKKKQATAEFIQDEQLPQFDVQAKTTSADQVVSASASSKKVGVYHTHNDESYLTGDGYDSVYGKGGIHDVGASFVKKLENLGINVVYREDLHLPHNSGAYTRSQVTASSILNTGNVDAIFDVHRDSTPRSEFYTTVNGQEMSKVRMVIGSANQNYYENKEFAYAIKGYADKVYPGLIKDIYMGKGNYNQQLSSRGMLFEMGCDKIEKALVLNSVTPLAKTVDIVLYGSNSASEETLNDVELKTVDGKSSVVTGIVSKKSTASVSFIWILLAGIAFYFVVLGIVCIFSKEARYRTKRFFCELFPFKRKK